MDSVNLLILQMVATRASAEALATQITAMINSIQQVPAPAPAPTVPPMSSPEMADSAALCDHPANERYPCARMGYPNAYMCRVCGEEVLAP